MKEKVEKFKKKYLNFRANEFVKIYDELLDYAKANYERISPDTKKALLAPEQMTTEKDDSAIRHKWAKTKELVKQKEQKTSKTLTHEEKVELVEKDILNPLILPGYAGSTSIYKMIFDLKLIFNRVKNSVENLELSKKITTAELIDLTQKTIEATEESNLKSSVKYDNFLQYAQYCCKQIDLLEKYKDYTASQELKKELLKKNQFVIEYIELAKCSSFLNSLVYKPVTSFTKEEIIWAEENNINLIEEETMLIGSGSATN